jgi:hypothetical protein
MKKLVCLIRLMALVRKENVEDSWLTNLKIYTSVLPQTMGRDRSEAICQS